MRVNAVLEQLHPAAGDAVAACAALERACQGCDAALAEGAALAAVAEALEHVLGSPRNLLSALWLVQRLVEPAEARRYQDAVRGASAQLEVRIDRLLLRLSRLLASASPAAIQEAGLSLPAVRAARVAGHLPSDEAAEQITRLRLDGLEASIDKHHAAVWGEPYAELRVGDEAITVDHRNARALMRDGRVQVRRDAARATAAHALKLAPVLEPLKRGRIEHMQRMARLAGYASMLEQLYAESGLTAAALAALQAQAPRITAFCARYFAWKQRRLGLARLTEIDLAARAESAAVDLTFERVLEAAAATSAAIDPTYPAILDELRCAGVLITAPEQTRSAEWACIPNLAGGSPIVHVPYFADYETYVAAAHELGHACQITASVRRTGALLQHDAPAWHAEIFSLRFELDAIDFAIEHAPTKQTRAFWIEAAIDQWLHFVRTLPIAARFEQALRVESGTSRERASALRAEAWRALSPAGLEPAVPGEDARWLLDSVTERMPCAGYSYGLAMLIAYRSKLDGKPLAELADHGAMLSIDDACAQYLGFDIEDPAAFQPVWRHLEALCAQLA